MTETLYRVFKQKLIKKETCPSCKGEGFKKTTITDDYSKEEYTFSYNCPLCNKNGYTREGKIITGEEEIFAIQKISNCFRCNFEELYESKIPLAGYLGDIISDDENKLLDPSELDCTLAISLNGSFKNDFLEKELLFFPDELNVFFKNEESAKEYVKSQEKND
jgi:predicted nucleic-acid-binding Zn-ribbon protein